MDGRFDMLRSPNARLFPMNHFSFTPMLPLLFLVLAGLGYGYGQCNNDTVLALPVTDVVLSNDHTFRGVPIAAGNPPANISFLPTAIYNDTCKC